MSGEMDLDQFDDHLLAQIIRKMDTVSLINFKKASKWTEPFVAKMGKQAIFRIPHEIHINAYLDDTESVYFIINHLKFNNYFSYFQCAGPIRYTDASAFEEKICVTRRGLRFSAIRFYGLWKEENNGEEIIKSLERITSSLSKYNIQCEEISFNRISPTNSIIQMLKPKRLEINFRTISGNSLETKILKNLRKMTIQTSANGDVLELCRGLTECRVDLQILSGTLPARQIIAFIKETALTHNALRLHGVLNMEEAEKLAENCGFAIFPGRGVAYLVDQAKDGLIVIRSGGTDLEAKKIQAGEELQKAFRKFCHSEEISTREEIVKKYFK